MNTCLSSVFCILISIPQSWCVSRPPVINSFIVDTEDIYSNSDDYYPPPGNYYPPSGTYYTGTGSYYPDYKEKVVPIDQYKISSIMPPDGVLLTSPRWSAQENVLYFADKYGEKFYRLNPESNNMTVISVGYGPTGIIEPVQDAPGVALVAVRAGLYLLVWDSPDFDGEYRQLTNVDLSKPNNIISGAQIDNTGKIWFGTMGKLVGSDITRDQGTFYSMSNKNLQNPNIKIRPTTVTSGVAFSKDYTKLFFNDRPTKKVVAYDYNSKTGNIGNKTVLFDFDKLKVPGLPIDMTIDNEDNLWIATFEGSKILKIDSRNGDILDQISLPVDQVTSAAWGGQDLSTLYVTTGKLNIDSPKPLSGRLLSITNTRTRGVTPPAFFLPNAKSIALGSTTQ